MGIGGNIEMWQPFEQALEGSGIQTITFDAPGVGESTNWRRPRRMGALARTVDRLVGALGYEAVDVLGVSFGGALAQQLARQFPDRVRRLVLAATAPGVSGARRRPRPAERDAGAGDAAPVLLARVLPQGCADALRRANQARARADGRAGPRAHDPPSVAAGVCRAALCDELRGPTFRGCRSSTIPRS